VRLLTAVTKSSTRKWWLVPVVQVVERARQPRPVVHGRGTRGEGGPQLRRDALERGVVRGHGGPLGPLRERIGDEDVTDAGVCQEQFGELARELPGDWARGAAVLAVQVLVLGPVQV
jgi:hypothetical protein